MPLLSLSDDQHSLIQRPLHGTVFIEGPVGAGKTTAAVERLLHLLRSGIPPKSIMVLVPQRTLAAPFYEALRRPTQRRGRQAFISTIGGLAQRMVGLFWPMISGQAGFAHTDMPPTFLTLETAQYYMACVVEPLLEEGYFDGIVVNRNRIYSQIIDNLNKAAVVGFPHSEIGDRLKSAWGGDSSQARVYDEAQECASRFRQYCLEHNILDFSLQLEVFVNHTWTLPLCHDYLLQSYRHLIVDNAEEDVPVAHDLLKEWLPQCTSGLVVYDRHAGYRRFLGADPMTALTLRDACQERVSLDTSFTSSSEMIELAAQLGQALEGNKPQPSKRVSTALSYQYHRYYPQMLDDVVQQVSSLVQEDGVPPSEIVILAPFMPDGLRFSLANRLQQSGVGYRSHRPSRSLNEEPAARCLLTLASMAHPGWGESLPEPELAYALVQSIEGMDLVRAHLLANQALRSTKDGQGLVSFAQLAPELQARVTFLLGERYERLRQWLQGYINHDVSPLDHFLARLFGEVLSQQGFRFHDDYDAGEITAQFIESVRKFRWVTEEDWQDDGRSPGQEYLQLLRQGVIAAQYVNRWREQPDDAVLLSPAYTYLMSNRTVDHQFWLDVGSSGWWERLYQPLTHPYVLSRQWEKGVVWTDVHESAARVDGLFRLTQGLLLRCRKKVHLESCELGERGTEQQGELQRALYRVLRRLPRMVSTLEAGGEADAV